MHSTIKSVCILCILLCLTSPQSHRAPSLIVIDDLHLLCPHHDLSPGESERQLTAALGSCLDTLSQQPVGRPVVVMATTCALDQVEPSLRRPGRFDKEIEVSVPTVVERVKVQLPSTLKQSVHLPAQNVCQWQ